VIGHIPFEIKDQVFAEMFRVLKKGGRSVHVAETDSTSCWARFAHKDPALFRKYFVDVPGHISLEMPSQLRQRFNKHGFKEIIFTKINGNVQECGTITGIFDNEYRAKSRFLSFPGQSREEKAASSAALHLSPDHHLAAPGNLRADGRPQRMRLHTGPQALVGFFPVAEKRFEGRQRS
jgi:hypothetical protein